ncbi:uncharacterized protein EKO05_0010257 [Ascochyta rabiei]|uniref:Uncharacterized protein n=1 Tax=Didymella rabiei TaxID=5454 RepID=A0A163F1U7_DIDRA|nr:uncharacterized protein EKO05_0010257 [Ascochyta rabiei]KZM24086.1 hypothetical protein ST47_g4745 [Ascochyta rabiei]UPX20011.1 hypothetical protein EKO05_0010257 [Ascochyta rabiei]
MAGTAELGLLIHAKAPKVDIPIGHFDAVIAAAEDSALDEKTVADKSVKDAQEAPSLWFVNFPSKEAATSGSKELGPYMQDVLDYRCWASNVWWKTVYSNSKVPQDGSKESTAKRSAFAAKVGMKHMTQTPWLAMSANNNVSKNIECSTNEFHTKLITDVLEGFVDITPSVFKALEAILQSLSKTVEVSSETGETRTIVCEKYQYIPEADSIRSYVRLISFSVSNKMQEIHTAKRDRKDVKCTIEYVEYEAAFNRSLWRETSRAFLESQKKASLEFVQKQTIDCDP